MSGFTSLLNSVKPDSHKGGWLKYSYLFSLKLILETNIYKVPVQSEAKYYFIKC